MVGGEADRLFPHKESLKVVRFRRAGQDSTGSESGQPVPSSRAGSLLPDPQLSHHTAERGGAPGGLPGTLPRPSG